VLQQQLCSYAVFLASGSLSFPVIQTYCTTAVVKWHQYNGIVISTAKPSMLRLHTVLAALKRQIPAKINHRLPLTPDLLVKMSLQADNNLNLTNICHLAMQSLLIYACRRLGEVCRTTIAEFDPSKHVTLQCVALDESSGTMVVIFPTTKTRQNGPPLICAIKRQSHHTSFCAFKWMRLWLTHSGITDPNAPLFQRITQSTQVCTGQPLLKQSFIKTLQQKIRLVDPEAPFKCFTGHSFRIAAATILALLCGMPDSTVMEVGDWSSECFRKYITMSHHQKLLSSSSLGGVFSQLQNVFSQPAPLEIQPKGS
jgi:hypothetical protein